MLCCERPSVCSLELNERTGIMVLRWPVLQCAPGPVVFKRITHTKKSSTQQQQKMKEFEARPELSNLINSVCLVFFLYNKADSNGKPNYRIRIEDLTEL